MFRLSLSPSLLVVISIGIGCASCFDYTKDWRPGGLYSVFDGEGGFGFTKILAMDEEVVNVRLYKESFKDRPTHVDPAKLSLGSVNDPDGFGMGHLPLSRREFSLWFPVFVSIEKVTEEELVGYRLWKESGGGALDSREMAKNPPPPATSDEPAAPVAPVEPVEPGAPVEPVAPDAAAKSGEEQQ